VSRSGGERPVESAVIRLAEAAGGQAFKMNPAFYAGIPDRLVVLPQQPMFFVETKAPDGKPSKAQLRWHKLLRLIGHTVLVPASVEAVEEIFRERNAG
jgi:hypothetical protein